METYEKIRPKLDTGDLVLFSGKGGISAGIKWFTSSKWSHVGMVVLLSEWDMILLWESTNLQNLADITTGTAHKGVQLVLLSERIRTYDGAVALRLLDVERTPAMLAALAALRTELKGRPYEKDELELIKAGYDLPLGSNREDLSSLFCSELVAEAYQRMGLLDTQRPSNEYTPKDFSARGKLKLLKGALGKELRVRA